MPYALMLPVNAKNSLNLDILSELESPLKKKCPNCHLVCFRKYQRATFFSKSYCLQ